MRGQLPQAWWESEYGILFAGLHTEWHCRPGAYVRMFNYTPSSVSPFTAIGFAFVSAFLFAMGAIGETFAGYGCTVTCFHSYIVAVLLICSLAIKLIL